MDANQLSYAELIAYAAGEVDETTARGISEYLETHWEGAAVVARFHVLCTLMRYASHWQPPEFLLARAKALYRSFGYRS